jgi:TonB family protein
MTHEMEGLIREDRGDNGVQPELVPGDCAANAALPCKSMKDGYSFPKCVLCPNPKYSSEGITRRLEGTVVLMAIVDENGRIGDIKALKALPYGLTRNAIQTVQTWTFRPAQGPDGKPLAVRQKINVNFDFNRR